MSKSEYPSTSIPPAEIVYPPAEVEVRHSFEESGYAAMQRISPTEVVLTNSTGKKQIWRRRDLDPWMYVDAGWDEEEHWAENYAIVFDGIDYQYICDIK